MAIKKSDLYSSLWASCDELRGNMDSSQYKDYVLFMLFIKYISDKYADSDVYSPSVVIPKGAGFKDMVKLKNKPNIGENINTKIIIPLVKANHRLALSDFPNFNDPIKLGEGSKMVSTLSNLIEIFENPALDFSNNRVEHDDILGDAYEYLIRHFAYESGKSKGQFYTPAEVSRVVAKVVGISSENSRASTTVYDPTCGSGSLLLKVAAESGKSITLEGQEKDITTAGLSRMNMILHDFPTSNIEQGNTLSDPKFLEGKLLRTYDYVVANPPFSDKVWSKDVKTTDDPYKRFIWGIPPKKQGDYAYLLHIIASMKKTGKGACILPHGVLYRGNAEAIIRKELIKSGILKCIIGLPANLFYGTGIAACILVLDKESALQRKTIFMIDASKDFIKQGPKNQLREQDIHKITDIFSKLTEIPGYSRNVLLSEIKNQKNEYNLNISRYIDSVEKEDTQDIDGHIRGGIPEQDINTFNDYWKILPSLAKVLFESFGRPGYIKLKLPISEVKTFISSHPEFVLFNKMARKLFDDWKNTNTVLLKNFKKNKKPKKLIENLSETLLASFKSVPLINSYNIYQHLMDYWNQTMQDDVYLISANDWYEAAQPREIFKIKNEKNQLKWPKEKFDYQKGSRRFKSDLLPVEILINYYFISEHKEITSIEAKLENIDYELQQIIEDNCGEDGLLEDVIEGDADNKKITLKILKDRLKQINNDSDYLDEHKLLNESLLLIEKQITLKNKLKSAQNDLEAKVESKYSKLTDEEIKNLVVDNKWFGFLTNIIQGEIDRVSQTLTIRIRELAERYESSLPIINKKISKISDQVNEHLKKMGFTWN